MLLFMMMAEHRTHMHLIPTDVCIMAFGAGLNLFDSSFCSFKEKNIQCSAHRANMNT